MWDKCESCGKQIKDASDCRLTTNDGEKIHTYCLNCYTQKQKATTPITQL